MIGDEEFQDLYGEWGRDVYGVPLPLSVRTASSGGALGPKFAEPKSHPGLPQVASRRLVRSSTGNEVTAGTTVYAPLSLADDFTLGSRVTLADGRESTVLTVSMADALGFPSAVVIVLE